MNHPLCIFFLYHIPREGCCCSFLVKVVILRERFVVERDREHCISLLKKQWRTAYIYVYCHFNE
jgi:hypothetical protein